MATLYCGGRAMYMGILKLRNMRNIYEYIREIYEKYGEIYMKSICENEKREIYIYSSLQESYIYLSNNNTVLCGKTNHA